MRCSDARGPLDRLRERPRADRDDQKVLDIDAGPPACAPPEITLTIGSGSSGGSSEPSGLPERYAHRSGRRRRRTPPTPRARRLRRAARDSGCRRARAGRRRPRSDRKRRGPRAQARSRRETRRPLRRHPCLRSARRRRGARTPRAIPVEAPDGTTAAPSAPLSSQTAQATVGVPRESSASHARTRSIRSIATALAPGFGATPGRPHVPARVTDRRGTGQATCRRCARASGTQCAPSGRRRRPRTARRRRRRSARANPSASVRISVVSAGQRTAERTTNDRKKPRSKIGLP